MRRVILVLVLMSMVAVLSAIGLAFWSAPTDGNMGIVQKIFYFHVPSAVASYIGFGLCTLGSIIYLLKPVDWADWVARAGAELGVLFASLVLITGPLWAYKSWGSFWEWEPRLTSMLLTFLMYWAYLLLRRFGGEGEIARKIGAVMGVLGLVGVALVRVSVELWGGIHPQVITGKGGGIAAAMVPPFAAAMTGFMLLALALILQRISMLRMETQIDQLHLRLTELEYDTEDL